MSMPNQIQKVFFFSTHLFWIDLIQLNKICLNQFKSKASVLGKFHPSNLCSYILILFFSTSFFLFSSCSYVDKPQSTMEKYHLTQEEYTFLKEFFQDLLFEEVGAYTLYGTKPMTDVCLCRFTQEEKQEIYEQYLLLSDEEKTEFVFPKYDSPASYKKWKEIKERFPITRYLTGDFPSPYDGTVDIFLFVNIELTIKTLLDHYEEFHRLLGFHFDPLAVVFEIENRNSKFWNAVLKQNVLVGILLGFGRYNAWCFMWDYVYEDTQNRVTSFLKSFSVKATGESYINNLGLEHLSLPIFMDYSSDNDDLLKKYEKERSKIKDLYKGRDQVGLALEWLTR